MQCVCVNCKLKTKHIPSPNGQQIARILLSSSKYTPCTILSAEHAPMPNPFITLTSFRSHGCGPVAVCPGSRTTYSDGRDAHPILTLARSDAFLLSSTETNKPIGGKKNGSFRILAKFRHEYGQNCTLDEQDFSVYPYRAIPKSST